MATTNGTRRAFDLLRNLPRVSLENLKPNKGASMESKRKRGSKTHGCGSKGSKARQNFMPVGYETGNTPFHLRFKTQTWYKDHHLRLSYIPINLQKLQLTIDLNRLRTDIPIDVTQLCNTGLHIIKPLEREGGFILEDDGMEKFSAQINIEVQWATEPIIAAIERHGGVITTAYYDPMSLEAAINPLSYFTKGKPIPRRKLPPPRLIEYYSNAKNRGYLADPDEIAEERLVLAQKYGYSLPDLKMDPKYEMLIQRKDPRQVFFGLQPGWVVNVIDKNILKPKDPQLIEYYQT